MNGKRVTAVAEARFNIRFPDTSGMSEQEIDEARAEELLNAKLFQVSFEVYNTTMEDDWYPTAFDGTYLVMPPGFYNWKLLNPEEELELSKLAENILDPSQNSEETRNKDQ